MRDLFELSLDRRVDPGVIVAVQIRPNRRIRVEIFTSANVVQHRTFARDNDHRLALQPVAHLGEGMPDKLVIKLGKRMHLNF